MQSKALESLNLSVFHSIDVVSRGQGRKEVSSWSLQKNSVTKVRYRISVYALCT